MTLIRDADGNTKVQAEKFADENKVRIDLNGVERWRFDGLRLEALNNGQSVFIGEESGLSDDNTMNQNTAIGFNALKLNSTGGLNVAIGHSSLMNATNRNCNVAIGYQALMNNNTNANSAIGYQAFAEEKFKTVGSKFSLNKFTVGHPAHC